MGPSSQRMGPPTNPARFTWPIVFRRPHMSTSPTS